MSTMAKMAVSSRPQAKRRWATLWKQVVAHRLLILLFLPGLAHLIIFRYFPMYGIILAFKKFDVQQGIWGSPWVGLANFQKLWNSFYFTRIVRNAVLLSVYSLIFGFPAPILLAIMLNEVANKTYKRAVQTISYFPHFIAPVTAVAIVITLLSLDPNSGVVNRLLGVLKMEPIAFLARPEWFRPIYIGMGIWQNAGWGAIIYLAALAAVDVAQYEAAIIDGANRLQLIRYVTVPALIPTAVILLILNISGLLRSGMETILVLYSPATYETADVIETFVYRRGIVGEGGARPDMPFATAVGLFQSVIGFVLIIVANRIAKKATESSLW